MRLLFPLVVFAMSACSDDRPPAPSAADNAHLDEAGDMLDALGNEKGAAPDGTAPSNLANEVG